MRLSPPVAPVAIQTATRLRRQLAAGRQVDASHFWREVNSLALPLVTAINGADDEREVTFLWRAASPLRGVYVRLNRVTDKDNVAKGMFRRGGALRIGRRRAGNARTGTYTSRHNVFLFKQFALVGSST